MESVTLIEVIIVPASVIGAVRAPVVITFRVATMVLLVAQVIEVLMKVVIALVMAVMVICMVVIRIILLVAGAKRREGIPEENTVLISVASDGNPIQIGLSWKRKGGVVYWLMQLESPEVALASGADTHRPLNYVLRTCHCNSVSLHLLSLLSPG